MRATAPSVADTAYRNDLARYVNAEMKIIVVGGSMGPDVRERRNWEQNTEMMVYEQLIGRAKNQLDWLLKELRDGRRG